MLKKKDTIRVGLLFLALFILVGVTDFFDDFNQLFEQIIIDNPLPDYYFPAYFTLGLAFPLALRVYMRDRLNLRNIIDSYFVLLFFQILSELVVVLLIGKGISVVVGLFFSSLRLIQLRQLLLIAKNSTLTNRFLYFQFVLWTFNILQIIFNRLLYLIYK